MKFRAFRSIEKRPSADAIIVCFARDGEKIVPCFDDPVLQEKTSCVPLSKEFTAACGSSLWLYPNDGVDRRIIALGLGDLHAMDRVSVREAMAKLFLSFAKKPLNHCIIVPPSDQEEHIEALIEGVYIGSYRFVAYKQPQPGCQIEEISILYPNLKRFQELEGRLSPKMVATAFARDLVNKNADDVTPDGLAQVIASLAGRGLTVDVYDEHWIFHQKMGLIEAVARGAACPARFVLMRWRGDPESLDHTVLIGKGITFDTGGLNLKTGDFMQHMKGDMAGAAAVVATMMALRDCGVPINVTAVLPLCENSIGSRAYKPGDVIRSRQGITVEIANTDAEGRLILADALNYAVTELAPSRIIDVATLTGAADVALGSQLSALFSNTDALFFDLEKAAKQVGEPLWRMPLRQSYLELLESDVADVKNVSGRSGGAINAALFLQMFVGKTPWAHFDIAGTAFNKEAHSGYSKGATGVPVRTVIQYFESLSKKEGSPKTG